MTVWLDDSPDPASQDQFWLIVVASPLVHMRSMIGGLVMLCGKCGQVPSVFGSVKPFSWVYSTKGSRCFLFFLMLLYMRGSMASSEYHGLWWQLKSPEIIVSVCVVYVAWNWLASAADGALLLMIESLC